MNKLKLLLSKQKQIKAEIHRLAQQRQIVSKLLDNEIMKQLQLIHNDFAGKYFLITSGKLEGKAVKVTPILDKCILRYGNTCLSVLTYWFEDYHQYYYKGIEGVDIKDLQEAKEITEEEFYKINNITKYKKHEHKRTSRIHY